MRFPKELTQMEREIVKYFPQWRPAQQRGFALWVYGTIVAKSGCQTAVILALRTFSGWHALRQRLREWLYDGADKAATCQTQVAVVACFLPVMRWVMAWWQSPTLALGIDATLLRDQVVALVVSVLYRGSAIPVAWHILPANRPGAWMPQIVRLLRQLRPAVPADMLVLVLADRGLWSPWLWRRIRRLRWHPLLRLQATTTFAPMGQARQPVRALVPQAGTAWVGRGIAFRHHKLPGTLLVVWDHGQQEPWVLVTDMPPAQVSVVWYGLRVWIELGFRALKGIGWQWQRTRRTDPDRIARHWLVLAVAMLWVLAYGTRVEDADRRHVLPARLLTAPSEPPQPPPRPRRTSVFLVGWHWLRTTLLRGYLWTRLWLLPDPWPQPETRLTITYHYEELNDS
jgi:Transposase DDE domain